MNRPNADSRAKDLLNPDRVSIYEAQVRRVWWVLIRTRESMHFVNGITKFPLNKFVDHHELGFFWNTLLQNCRNAVIVNFNSLLNDREKNTLSARKLTNSIRNWLNPDYLEWYTEKLRAAKFDIKLNEVAERVRVLRHAVSHILLQNDGMPANFDSTLSEGEMESIYLATKDLFSAATLTEEFVIDFGDYQKDATPKAVDRLLETIARGSPWINSPEARGQWWTNLREHMAKEELEELNTWRIRLGLPPA